MHRKSIKHFDVLGHAHELTFSCVDRADLLVDATIRSWLVDSISRARIKHQFHLWAYVFMPNHVHLLVLPIGESYEIKKILQSIKQPVGRRVMNRAKGIGELRIDKKIMEHVTNRGRFWQAGPGYDCNVLDSRTAIEMAEYIHHNPVRKGLVDKPEDWIWSSAAAWAGNPTCPLKIDKEMFPS